jgi:hypothetical protein
MVTVGLAAMPWGGAVSSQEISRVAAPPILEELCARLASFGLVEPMGMAPRSAPMRECKPVLLLLGDLNASETTSIFTTIRAGPGRIAGSPFIRFKINMLEARTQGQAIALVDRAVRSLLRGYDLEMPYSLAVALQQLEAGSHQVGPIQMEITTERQDTRRYNIFLSIQSLEKRRTNFRRRDFSGQVPGGL